MLVWGIIVTGTETSQEQGEENSTYGWVAVLILVFNLLLLAVFMLASQIGFENTWLNILAIFMVSMDIGIAGAMVFLIMQLLMETEIGLLDRLMKSKYGISPETMITLFLISGGLVAGFTQASSGDFGAGNIWTVFLIGFGWQGVMTGIGSAATVRDTATEGAASIKELKDDTQKKLLDLSTKYRARMQELDEQLRLAETSPSVDVADVDSLGEIIEEGGS